MLWIETGIVPPKKELLERAAISNATVFHLPALTVQNLHTDFSLNGTNEKFDAAFVASPRAAKLASEQLKNCVCDIYAVGEGTAKAIEKYGTNVKQFGDGSGADAFLAVLLQNGCKFKNIAWISAEETAADLSALAKKYGMNIHHIAVYRTSPAEFTAEDILKIKHPCKWILRSGKGVKAVQKFFKKQDAFEAIGKSAEEALKEISINVTINA